MRKHRLYGVVIAVLLLGTTPFKPRPSSQHLSTSSDSDRYGMQLAAAVLPADQTDIASGAVLPALFVDDAAPPPSAVVPVPPPAPPAPPAPAPQVVTAALASPAPPPPPPRSVLAAGTPGVWAALRHCESGGNYADNTGNGYYGAYQFSLGTWRGLGLSGLPSQAAPAVQDEAAQRLEARSGWGQWPSCSRRLRL